MRAWRVVIVGVGALVVSGLLAPVAGAASMAGTSDKQIAQAGTIVASDLPATYTQTANDTSSDASTEKVAKGLSSCKKFVAFRKSVDKYPKAHSDEFSQGQTQIDDSVSVFPSAKKAKAAVDSYIAAGLPKCFDQLMSKIATQAGGKAQSSIKQVKDVTAGDQAVAYEGPVQITETDGSTSTLAFGNLVIRVGRGVAVYSYNHDANTSITQDLTGAVNQSGARLQAALAG